VLNTKLVTHKNCLDGAACAILFMRAGGAKENIVFTVPTHNATDEIAMDLIYNWEDPIIFADISVSKQVADNIDNLRSDVTLIDHHKSANELIKYPWAVIDRHNKNCGSKIFLGWLQLNSYLLNIINEKMFVDVVDDVDRWIWENSKSRDISTLFHAYEQDLFIDRFYKNLSLDLSDTERAIILIEDCKRDRYVEEKLNQVTVFTKRINDKKYRIGIIDSNRHQSLLGNKMCNSIDLDIDFAIIVGSRTLSFRAKGDNFDVSQIAELNGGGGHKSASGCPINKVLGKPIPNLIIKNLRYEK